MDARDSLFQPLSLEGEGWGEGVSRTPLSGGEGKRVSGWQEATDPGRSLQERLQLGFEGEDRL